METKIVVAVMVLAVTVTVGALGVYFWRLWELDPVLMVAAAVAAVGSAFLKAATS